MTRSANCAFSLIEVSAALAIVSVALISLLGLIPIGLANSRATRAETRAAELARMVYSTVASEPFTASPCFDSINTPLNFSTLDQSGDSTPATLLFASYDSRRQSPSIVRATAQPTEMTGELEIFRMELRNQPQRFSATDAAIVGSELQMKVFIGREKQPIYTTSSYIGSFAKAGVLKQTSTPVVP